MIWCYDLEIFINELPLLIDMAIKKDDFIEIEYTGKVEGKVFDTTDEAKAKEASIQSPKVKYGPIIFSLEDNHLVKGLVNFMIGKEVGEYNVEVPVEEAFGKKSAKLIQIIPTRKFKDSEIKPMPGLQINVDGAFGIIKTITGGRTLVDFNHPLSGKDVSYELKINRIITDPKEKIKAILMQMSIEADINVEGDKAKVVLKEKLPEQVLSLLKEQIKKSAKIEAEITTC